MFLSVIVCVFVVWVRVICVCASVYVCVYVWLKWLCVIVCMPVFALLFAKNKFQFSANSRARRFSFAPIGMNYHTKRWVIHIDDGKSWSVVPESGGRVFMTPL